MAISKKAIFKTAEQIVASSAEPRLNGGWGATSDGRFSMIFNAVHAHETEIATLKEQLQAALIRGDKLLHSESTLREEANIIRNKASLIMARLVEAHDEINARSEKKNREIESLRKALEEAKKELENANSSLSFMRIEARFREDWIEFYRRGIEALYEGGSRDDEAR